MSPHPRIIAKTLLVLVLLILLAGLTIPDGVRAYSATSERPVFLAWPLPSYIGLARISQFPNTPWTWNYLGLNPGQQCPPAFGYVGDPTWWYTWRDKSLPEKEDLAQADPHNFQMVNCYSTLGAAGENGHEGTDIKAPAGSPVYASADGKVAGTILNNAVSAIVLKHCLNGQWNKDNECVGGTKWYTTYMHIHPSVDLLELNKDVSEGTQVGTVYNQGDNSHLHFELGLEQRSYKNYVNPWGRDAAPWYGCMWKDQSLCVQPNPGYRRMGVLTGSDRFFLRDDASRIVEVYEAEGIQQIRLAGQRAAVIDAQGNLLAKDIFFKRSLPSGHEFLRNWIDLASNVVSYQITPGRVAILEQDGTLKVKSGDLNNPWTIQAKGVHSFSMSEHRIGYLTSDGKLFVQEGELKTDWLGIGSNVKAFQLSDTRIAVLDMADNLFVQEGVLTGEWKSMGTKVRAFQLAGTRVAVIDENSNLLVNDGNLRAEWVLQAEHVRRFQLADDRILILDKDGKWKLKQGDLYQAWQELTGFTAREIQLNGGVGSLVVR